jgi:hypothetical protein
MLSTCAHANVLFLILGAGGWTILKWILERMGWSGLDGYGSGYGPVEGSCDHCIEPSGFLKCWEVLEWLNDWWPLKKGSAP